MIASDALDGTLALRDAPAAAAEARAYVRTWLEARDIGDDCLETAVLLTSEVVTNALRYAPPPLALTLHLADALLHVEVLDSSPGELRPRDPGPDAEGGRGLLLVAELAQSWGVVHRDVGKVVWFDLDAA